jgi:hypothetical protein
LDYQALVHASLPRCLEESWSADPYTNGEGNSPEVREGFSDLADLVASTMVLAATELLRNDMLRTAIPLEATAIGIFFA